MKSQLFFFEELLIEILSWLPVKSIIKFRCVSKTWKSLISDSQFVKLHLQRSSSRNTDFSQAYLLIRSFELHNEILDQEYVTYPSISSLLERHPTRVAIRSRLHDHHFIGSCNGLISLEKADCTTEKYSSQVCFWNPATRSKSQHSPPLYDHESSGFGFGYDCLSDTYKVVAAMLFEKTMVNVYNMGDRRWRRIQVSPFPSLHLERGVAVYVSNTLNWLATIPADIMQENLGIDMYTIVSFDLGKEELIQLPLPYSPRRIYEFQYFEPILGVLRGSLSISQNDSKTHNFVLWQMKEFGVHKSWTKLFSIIVSEKIIYRPCFAICMDENGDALLFTKYGISQLALYTKKEHKLEGLKVSNRYWGRHVNNYTESLISPY
ncbi:F-box/kelch-repeat protein At3g23880-like [Lotus japonicus]|uniref:F-box/kelch-repeat protein At3g23880-like n=1 Tax=Lotus japonicus TaxID=34305 RepID=UPI00258AD6A6|nr:F-box/kelch-repeat protein At3g23880-like [Lotus japonicus]